MTQTLYAHMNKIKIFKKRRKVHIHTHKKNPGYSFFLIVYSIFNLH
jgi:hypothetical protein